MHWRLAAVAVLLLASASWGDEITLKNGDKLTGRIAGMTKGKLVIETPHSGHVTVAWDQIASIKTDEKIPVTLATGERLEGKLSAGEGGRLRIESEGAAQPVEVELARVTHIRQAAIAWHGSVDVAARATDGNTHTKGFLLAAEAIRESEIDKWTVRALYRSSETSGALTERSAYGLGKYQYFVFEPGYVFGSVELFHDRFRDLRLRTVLAGGVGWNMLDREWLKLSAEVGLAFIDNNFYEEDDESHLGGRLNVNLRAPLPFGFEFVNDFTYFPNFDDTADWQIHNEATLATTLGGGWTFKAGYILDFDNEPSEGIEERDGTYFMGLGYRF